MVLAVVTDVIEFATAGPVKAKTGAPACAGIERGLNGDVLAVGHSRHCELRFESRVTDGNDARDRQ